MFQKYYKTERYNEVLEVEKEIYSIEPCCSDQFLTDPDSQRIQRG